MHLTQYGSLIPLPRPCLLSSVPVSVSRHCSRLRLPSLFPSPSPVTVPVSVSRHCSRLRLPSLFPSPSPVTSRLRLRLPLPLPLRPHPLLPHRRCRPGPRISAAAGGGGRGREIQSSTASAAAAAATAGTILCLRPALPVVVAPLPPASADGRAGLGGTGPRLTTEGGSDG